MDNTAHSRDVAAPVRVLLPVATLTLFAASAIHFGLTVPLGGATIGDPFPNAAVPEAILGVILGAGSLAVLAGWPRSGLVALTTAVFTTLVVLYGLSITVRGARLGDVAYHLTLLAMLLASIGLLLRRQAAGPA